MVLRPRRAFRAAVMARSSERCVECRRSDALRWIGPNRAMCRRSVYVKAMLRCGARGYAQAAFGVGSKAKHPQMRLPITIEWQSLAHACMVRRRERGHLVPVDHVVEIKVLDLCEPSRRVLRISSHCGTHAAYSAHYASRLNGIAIRTFCATFASNDVGCTCEHHACAMIAAAVQHRYSRLRRRWYCRILEHSLLEDRTVRRASRRRRLRQRISRQKRRESHGTACLDSYRRGDGGIVVLRRRPVRALMCPRAPQLRRQHCRDLSLAGIAVGE